MEGSMSLIDEYCEKYKDDAEFLKEEVIIDITEKISERMVELGFTSADLANRLGTSVDYVTQLLSGDLELYLCRLIQVAQALDCNLKIDFEAMT